MNVRWLAEIQQAIPAMDFEDLNISEDAQAPRQFAPEFSQSAYAAMFSKDIVIGDYINSRLTHLSFASKAVTSTQRE